MTKQRSSIRFFIILLFLGSFPFIRRVFSLAKVLCPQISWHRQSAPAQEETQCCNQVEWQKSINFRTILHYERVYYSNLYLDFSIANLFYDLWEDVRIPTLTKRQASASCWAAIDSSYKFKIRHGGDEWPCCLSNCRRQSFNYAKCCKVVTIGASFVYWFFAVVVLKVFSYRPSHGLEQLALATPQSGVRLTEVSI